MTGFASGSAERQADGTAGRRPKIAGRSRNRREAMQRIPEFIEREWLDVKLDVCAIEVWR